MVELEFSAAFLSLNCYAVLLNEEVPLAQYETTQTFCCEREVSHFHMFMIQKGQIMHLCT